MPSLSYSIERIAPGLVRICEEPEPYLMDEESILKAIETVQKHRTAYANELGYQRRLELFEHALQVAQQGKK